MKSKDYIIFGLVALVLVIAGYLLLRRGSASAAASELPTTDTADDTAFKAMYQKLSDKVGSGNMSWILKDVKSLMSTGSDTGGQPYASQFMMNGKRSKTGALLDVYNRGVANWADNGKFNQQFHDEMFAIWYNYSTNAQIPLI